MGGGIAFQSALKGTPIVMKDIADKALDLGMNEASKLLAKRVSKGKMDAAGMGKVLSAIRPTLSYDDFKGIDVVVEAVVENPKIKQSVLAETEEKWTAPCSPPTPPPSPSPAWRKHSRSRRTSVACTSSTRCT